MCSLISISCGLVCKQCVSWFVLQEPLYCVCVCVRERERLSCFLHIKIGNASAGRTTKEYEIDAWVKEALQMEDPDILLDLRHLNQEKEDKYAVFWEQCWVYLHECTAVHERSHDAVTYMARQSQFVIWLSKSQRDVLRVQLFHLSSGSTFNSGLRIHERKQHLSTQSDFLS